MPFSFSLLPRAGALLALVLLAACGGGGGDDPGTPAAAGALDASFAGGGKFLLPGSAVGHGPALQADGKILLGGVARNTGESDALARIQP